jgi:hypothetical protein
MAYMLGGHAEALGVSQYLNGLQFVLNAVTMRTWPVGHCVGGAYMIVKHAEAFGMNTNECCIEILNVYLTYQKIFCFGVSDLIPFHQGSFAHTE